MPKELAWYPPHALTAKEGMEYSTSFPKVQEYKEIKKIMAHDVPFIVARKISEGNKADNKWNIPIKNQKILPMLSQMDAVKEFSQGQLQSPKGFWQETQSLQNNTARILTGQVTSTSKRMDQERVGT
jgi:hypothetical protein